MHAKGQHQFSCRTSDLDAADLTDVQLLARLLGLSRTIDADVARVLIQRFGGLRGVFGASGSSLSTVPRMGRARAARVHAIHELVQRFVAEKLVHGQSLGSAKALHEFLQIRLQNLPYECFCAIFMDTRHRVLRFAPLFRGTLDYAVVHPREVVREALQCNAAAVIVAHNHPSDVAEPSSADEHLTKRLRDALALVDIRLLDHLIVGNGQTMSLAANGGF